MATEAQIKANRMNALKSTGPKSKKGKEVVSQNAVKHGLCTNKDVIRSESQDEFNEFKEDMIADLSPVGAMEYMLAERVVSLSWRLKRAEHFQNMAVDALIDFEMAVCRIDLTNARQEAKEGNIELLMGHVINRNFADSRTLDLLLTYERRIESNMFRVAAELRKMQKMRKAEDKKIRGEEDRTEEAESSKQSQSEKEYRTQNTENRMDSEAFVEKIEDRKEKDSKIRGEEDKMEETEFSKQSQSEKEYRTQNTENRMDSEAFGEKIEDKTEETEFVEHPSSLVSCDATGQSSDASYDAKQSQCFLNKQ